MTMQGHIRTSFQVQPGNLCINLVHIWVAVSPYVHKVDVSAADFMIRTTPSEAKGLLILHKSAM